MNTALTGKHEPLSDDALNDDLERVLQHLEAQRWQDAESQLQELEDTFGERPAISHYFGMAAFGRDFRS